jgi:hypothetical protein
MNPHENRISKCSQDHERNKNEVKNAVMLLGGGQGGLYPTQNWGIQLNLF